MTVAVQIANSQDALEASFAIRYQVFVEELRVLAQDAFPDHRESNAFDSLPTTVHILVRVDNRPAATVRLLLPNREVALRRGWDRGLAIEQHFRLPAELTENVGEITRSCVLPAYRRRSLPQMMWAKAVDVARQHGIRTFVAEAYPETSEIAIVEGYCRILAAAGLVSNVVRLIPRGGDPAVQNPGWSPIRTIDPREAVRQLPPALKLFVKMGVVVCGPPLMTGDYRCVSLPILWDLAERTPEQCRILELGARTL